MQPIAASYPRTRSGPIYRAAVGLAILCACILTFSVRFETVKPGLDESWEWALNAITQTNYIFGKDVVFTLGPLGFLLSPRPIAHNFQWTSWFAISMQVILAALLAAMAREARTRLGFFLFLGGAVIATAMG